MATFLPVNSTVHFLQCISQDIYEVRANTYRDRVDDGSDSQWETTTQQSKDGVAQVIRQINGRWCGGHEHSGLNRDPGVNWTLWI